MDQQQARRRALRRRDRRRVLWRIDVSSGDGCFKDRAGDAGGTFARQEICVARYAMAHATFATIRRYRNLTQPLLAPLTHSGGIAAKILGMGRPRRTRRSRVAMQCVAGSSEGRLSTRRFLL